VKQSPFIDEAVMIGDRRPYPILLVVPNQVKLQEWAAGRASASPARRCSRTSRVRAKIEEEALGNLADFARFEQPEEGGAALGEFTVESGVLTPTQKVKRRVVQERFSDVIESLYAEDRTTGAGGG
jgi:long-chain acyl-CoA synthetase